MDNTHTHSEHAHGEHHHTKKKLVHHAESLETWLASIFKDAPHIPDGGRKVIADILPWLAVIFGVLGIIALFSAGVVSLVLSPLIVLSGGAYGIYLFISIVLGLASSVLSFLSFNPLREMKKKGWDLTFYSLIISAISTVVSLVFMMGGLGGILGAVIGAYLIFEIRGMYH